MDYSKLFTPESIAQLAKVWAAEFPRGVADTLFMTLLSTFLALVIGLPLGVMLVAGDKNGVLPLPRWLMGLLNTAIDILRSIPFLILMVMVIPLSRLLVGTSVGTAATVVPLVVAAFPFVARLVESTMREVDPGVIEAAVSMGASPLQTIWHVMIRESVPGLAGQITTATTTILGYGAMAGTIGGGGLGKIAISYGYNRYQPLIMLVAVVLLVILVIAFQRIGTAIASGSDKRLLK